MVDRIVNLSGRGKRGTLSAVDKAYFDARTASAESASLDAEAARDAAADLVLPENKVVGGPLAAAEALFTAGTKFAWVHDGIIEVRERTVGGSTLIVQQPTAAALAPVLAGKSYKADTIAAMLALLDPADDAICVTAGYHSIGDGGGGTFRWDAGYSGPANNLMIFKSGATGAWLRIIDGITVTPAMAGIPLTSTGVNYSAALQEVIDCPRFAFPDGFSCDFGGLLNLTTSNQIGHFGTAKFKLLAGSAAGTWGICVGKGWLTSADAATRVREFPVNSVWYGGEFDGNIANVQHAENANGVSGGDGGHIGIVAADAVDCHWYGPKTPNWWTDGIILWDRHRRPTNHSTYCVLDGFHLHDAECLNNGRTNLVAVSCKDAHVYNGRFNDSGKIAVNLVGSGINIEPNPVSELNKDTVNLAFHGRQEMRGNISRGWMIQNPDQIVNVTFDRYEISDNGAVDFQFAQNHHHSQGSIGSTNVSGNVIQISGAGKAFAMTNSATPAAWVNNLKVRSLLVTPTGRVGSTTMTSTIANYASLVVAESYEFVGISTALVHAALIVAGRFEAGSASGSVRRSLLSEVAAPAIDILPTARANIGTLRHWTGQGVQDASKGGRGTVIPMDHTVATAYAGISLTSAARDNEYKVLFPDTFVIAGGTTPVSLAGNDADVTVRARAIEGNVVSVLGSNNRIVPDMIRAVGTSLIAFGASSAGNMVVGGRLQNQTGSASATDAATVGTGNKVVSCVPAAVNV